MAAKTFVDYGCPTRRRIFGKGRLQDKTYHYTGTEDRTYRLRAHADNQIFEINGAVRIWTRFQSHKLRELGHRSLGWPTGW
jgi:hypothetical protein